MKPQVIVNCLDVDLNGSTVEDAIKYLSNYTGRGYIIEKEYYGWDDGGDFELRIVFKETPQQKKERLAKEKVEKEAKKLENERKRYLELKAKFEGEQND